MAGGDPLGEYEEYAKSLDLMVGSGIKVVKV